MKTTNNRGEGNRYVAPDIEIISVAAEKGFAATDLQGGGGVTDLNDLYGTKSTNETDY